ncbi:MAG: hypothetical protein ACHQ5A_11325, partial [Opitutales bacterium]
MPPPVNSGNWTQDLARFLQSQPGITALRVDEAERKVAVATLGDVDTAELERQIAEVLVAIDQRLAAGGLGGFKPGGYTTRRSGGVTTLERESCATAPHSWVWREYALPAAVSVTG